VSNLIRKLPGLVVVRRRLIECKSRPNDLKWLWCYDIAVIATSRPKMGYLEFKVEWTQAKKGNPAKTFGGERNVVRKLDNLSILMLSFDSEPQQSVLDERLRQGTEDGVRA